MRLFARCHDTYSLLISVELCCGNEVKSSLDILAMSEKTLACCGGLGVGEGRDGGSVARHGIIAQLQN